MLANDAFAFLTLTITAVTGFDANNGCADFSFDTTTGIVSGGTPSFGSGSCGTFHYTISNSAGSSTTLVLITVTFN